MIISNAFSINMLVQEDISIRFSSISVEEVVSILIDIDEDFDGSEGIVNAIGHKETDSVVRDQLKKAGFVLREGKRLSVVFAPDMDTSHQMLVAQYRGPRLQEGATSLPEGATIVWWVGHPPL